MPQHSDLTPEERACLEALELDGPTACPPPAQLRALESGILPNDTTTRIEEHVRHCGICQMMLVDLRELGGANPTREEVNRIRARVFREAKLVRPRMNWPWWLVPAAALGLVAVIAGNLLYFERQSRQKPAQYAANRPSVSPPVPEIFQMDRPAAIMPPVVIWRGPGHDLGLETGLKAALDLYRSGNDAAAESRLEALVARYPHSAESYLYLGICQLLLAQNDRAITSLERARQLANGPLAGEASWYLSVALLRGGDQGEARAILEKLCQSSGPYQRRACGGLDELAAQQQSRP